MEVLVVVSTGIAILLLVVWVWERFRATGGDASAVEDQAGSTPLRVVVELPCDEHAVFVGGVLQRLEEGRMAGVAGSATVVATPERDPRAPSQVVLSTDHGPAALDAIVGQLCSEGYRVARTEGLEIELSRQAITRARVTVTRDGLPD